MSTTGVVFKYGDYEFIPRPLFTINTAPLKTPDGIGYGMNHTISLDGDLIIINDQLDSGILGVFDKVENLKDALNEDGKLLMVSCNDSPILSGYPTITSFDVSPESDNYTQRASYTINFAMPTTILGSGNDPFNSDTFPPFIESCNETWDIGFQDERMPFDWTTDGGTDEKFGYKVAVTHTVDVQARIAYTGSTVSSVPWQDAKTYATGKLGFDNDFVTLTGVLGLPGNAYFTQMDVFNNYRQVSIDKTQGSIQVIETFVVSPSGANSLPNNAIETFEIGTSQNDGITSVSINGEIEGLCQVSYTGYGGNNGFAMISSKFNAASGYFDEVKGRMYDRANTAYKATQEDCYNRPLSTIIKSRAVGINPIEGTISYDYEYDTMPSGCITGDCILSQNISIDDQLAADVFASHVMPGRAFGPILQDIGTKTVRTRTVNIELVTLPPTSCASVSEIYLPVPTGQVEEFISVISGDLTGSYSQVFVANQSQNWNFSVGRYTKTIAYTYTNCSG